MNTEKTGGAAFPTIGDVSHNPQFLTEDGMTLLDYFAAKAMQSPVNYFPANL